VRSPRRSNDGALPRIAPKGKERSQHINAVFSALNKRNSKRQQAEQLRRARRSQTQPMETRSLDHHNAMKDYWSKKKEEYQLAIESETTFVKDYWLLDDNRHIEEKGTTMPTLRIGSKEIRGAIPISSKPSNISSVTLGPSQGRCIAYNAQRFPPLHGTYN